MRNEWPRIWEQKGVLSLKGRKTLSLKDLIKIDGFDTPVSSYIYKIWDKRIKLIIKSLKINKDDFLLEIGSGSGAVIYPLRKKISLAKIVAVDYAFSLLKISREINKGIIHIQAEAKSLPFKKERFNKIIAHVVLFYFPSYDYALKALKEMDRILTPCAKILLMDIPDTAKKDECEKARIRSIGKEEYAKRYLNLPHLYYDRDFFVDFAQNFGYRITFFDTPDKVYPMSLFRYHVLLER